MVTELAVKQTCQVFARVAKITNPSYQFPGGGEPIRVVRTALTKLEKQYGSLSRSRIVDYVITSLYVFKNREVWRINQVLGPKSIERFDSDKGRRYYEDRWLATDNLTRSDLMALIVDRSSHPQAPYIYLPMEEITKQRLLNEPTGYAICQASTLGWSPESESCTHCKYAEECKIETSKKYPEIYRLRIEYGNQ